LLLPALLSAQPSPSTPKELDDYARREIVKWAKVVKDVKDVGIKVE